MKKNALIFVAVLVFAAGVVILFVSNKDKAKSDINSFEECTQAGYTIQTSYPAVCRTPDGQSFTDPTQTAPKPPVSNPSPQTYY